MFLSFNHEKASKASINRDIGEMRVNSQKHNLKVPSIFRKADIINLIINSKYS